jgi:hypothetical protein
MQNAKDANVPLDRDVVLRTLVRESSGALEDVVGLKEAAAAETLGYAKVETIAEGHPGCHVVVHLRRTPAAEAGDGREYFRVEEVT